MLDQQDADAAFARERADHRGKLLACLRCEADRRFVEQQQRRIGGQRADDLDHALLAARQCAGLLLGDRADPQQVQQSARARRRCRLGRGGAPSEQQAKEAAAHLRVKTDQHILQRGEIGKQTAVLERAACTARRDLVRRHPLGPRLR